MKFNVDDFVVPNEKTGDLGKQCLTPSKRYQVLKVLTERRDTFLTVENDDGIIETYNALWFKYPK